MSISILLVNIVNYDFVEFSAKINIVIPVKKEVIITARITPEIKEIIQSLADKDERTLGWIVRKLLLEALESRGVLKPDSHRYAVIVNSPGCLRR
jgi:hypothetical protein